MEYKFSVKAYKKIVFSVKFATDDDIVWLTSYVKNYIVIAVKINIKLNGLEEMLLLLYYNYHK